MHKTRKQSLALFIFSLFCFAILWGCGTGADSTPTPTPTPTPPTPTGAAVATISLSATPTTVKSDGSTATTITVNALNAANAALSDVTITMSANTGVISAATVKTNATIPATVTFSSPGNAINRTATITATAGTVTSQIPIQIVGSTITLTTNGSTLPADSSANVTLTVTAKDAGGNLVPNADIVLSGAGLDGKVTITPESGKTNNSGILTAKVTGVATGAVTLSAAGLGATATSEITVTGAAATFGIDQLKLSGGKADLPINKATAMKTTDTLEVRVNAPPPIAFVTFAVTTGLWNATSSVVTIRVVAGKATATLTTAQAGIGNVQVYDAANPITSDTLLVAMTSGAAAFKINLQATPTVVPKSVNTTTGSSTLIATVRDAGGFPVGGVPVQFSIVNPTGGGENVAPVVVLTATTLSGGLGLGEARASFTSGSSPSTAQGVKIRASVVGTAIQKDAAIVIGGVAGSVAFGMATTVSENDNKTQYILPMSVLVVDANGNPVSGAIVSLSAWPEAWSTGKSCAADADYISTYDSSTSPPTETKTYGNYGTFRNEDANENLYLDPGEDGKRTYYSGEHKDQDASGFTTIPPTRDGFLTPTNSAGGTLPSMVTTQANGVATFNLTYPKKSAIWTISRIRASVIVSGSETVGQIIFRLPAAIPDVTPNCLLGDSPYWW